MQQVERKLVLGMCLLLMLPFLGCNRSTHIAAITEQIRDINGQLPLAFSNAGGLVQQRSDIKKISQVIESAELGGFPDEYVMAFRDAQIAFRDLNNKLASLRIPAELGDITEKQAKHWSNVEDAADFFIAKWGECQIVAKQLGARFTLYGASNSAVDQSSPQEVAEAFVNAYGQREMRVARRYMHPNDRFPSVLLEQSMVNVGSDPIIKFVRGLEGEEELDFVGRIDVEGHEDFQGLMMEVDGKWWIVTDLLSYQKFVERNKAASADHL